MRHQGNITVLPLLANTKKDSLQAIYTSFVNMTDNRVLNNRPPPVNDNGPLYHSTIPDTASSRTPTKRD